MPTYDNSQPVRASQKDVWSFVHDIDNWAGLFPGYQRHLEVEPDHFQWQIRGEAGVWSRLVEFDVHVQEWNEPESVRFSLRGRTEPVAGSGRFFITPVDAATCRIGFELTADAKGPTAPMVNTLLDKFLSEQSGQFLRTLADRVGAEVGGGADQTPAEFPTGPGTIVVQYQAPRTAEFEAWMHGPHYDDLLSQPAVTGVTRFERIGTTGAVGSYLALISSDDLATTMRHRTTQGVAAMKEADRRGVQRGEWYLARTVYDRRLGRLARLRRRLRRAR
jgi:carbon monoxide dehydrogenase subunit G